MLYITVSLLFFLLTGARAQDSSESSNGTYSTVDHVVAIFVILVASLLGAVLPLVAKHFPNLTFIGPFALSLGKSLATGVVLAVSLIHMLLPANEALSSEKLPQSWRDADYEAFGYLFAVIAALLMQAIELFLEVVLRVVVLGDAGRVTVHEDSNTVVVETENNGNENDEAAALDEAQQLPIEAPSSSNNNESDDETLEVKFVRRSFGGAPSHEAKDALRRRRSLQPTMDQPLLEHPIGYGTAAHNGTQNHNDHGHSHSSSVFDSSAPSADPDSVAQRLIAAALMEFGVTLHSIFVGLAVGVVSDDDLLPLLVALCFHQFFEGIALGTRLMEASYQRALETVFAVIFSLAAPVGIAIGVAIVSTGDASSTEGGEYLLTQGILDSICAGILLYLGFGLLLHDFPVSLQRFCTTTEVVTTTSVADLGSSSARGSHVHKRVSTRKKIVTGFRWVRCAMHFLCLWGGVGVMAAIGKFL